MESTLKNLGIVVQNVLLANVTLKFLFWNMANTLIFFTENKMWTAHIFVANISMYNSKWVKLVKQTMFWTTGPREAYNLPLVELYVSDPTLQHVTIVTQSSIRIVRLRYKCDAAV